MPDDTEYGIPDDENPEWTEEDFARARPFREFFPEFVEAWEQNGKVLVAVPKVDIAFSLDPEIVESIRASGSDYNARVERVLREAIASGRL
jgi:uncharacterized protein (DUF4415 family)